MADSESQNPNSKPTDEVGVDVAPESSATVASKVAVPEKRDTTKIALTAGVVIAVVILIAGAFVAGSMSSAAKNVASDLGGSAGATLAIADFTINDSTSMNVYQQQVNGLWATKDLLKVVADQTANIDTLGSNIQATQTALVWTQVGVMALLVALIGIIATLGRRFMDVIPNRKAE